MPSAKCKRRGHEGLEQPDTNGTRLHGRQMEGMDGKTGAPFAGEQSSQQPPPPTGSATNRGTRTHALGAPRQGHL